MDVELIKKYGIKFKNSILNLSGATSIVNKVPITNLGYLTMFLDEVSVSDINESILPDIEEALVDSSSEIENGGGFVEITIYQDVVKFYLEGDDEIYSITTTDFKEIVKGWRDFLLTPPFNGTKI